MSYQGVQWYIDLTDAEQGQVIAFSRLLEVELDEYDSLAKFLDGCRGKICGLLDIKTKADELQDFAIWMTGCGYDFADVPYFCQQRDKLLKT